MLTSYNIFTLWAGWRWSVSTGDNLTAVKFILQNCPHLICRLAIAAGKFSLIDHFEGFKLSGIFT